MSSNQEQLYHQLLELGIPEENAQLYKGQLTPEFIDQLRNQDTGCSACPVTGFKVGSTRESLPIKLFLD